MILIVLERSRHAGVLIFVILMMLMSIFVPELTSAASLTATLDDEGSLTSAGYWIDVYEVRIEYVDEFFFHLSSEDFDSVLLLISPTGESFLNDDFREGDDSALLIEASDIGNWLIAVTTFFPGETGLYTLTAEPVLDPVPFSSLDDRLTLIGQLVADEGPVIEIVERERPDAEEIPPPQVYSPLPVAPSRRPASLPLYSFSWNYSPLAASPPEDPEEKIPMFPWPPPNVSSSDEIPWGVLFSDAEMEESLTFKDVDTRLSELLDEAGYHEHRYYRIPEGFIIVTEFERINKDGTALDGEAGLSMEVSLIKDFTPREYLQALFGAQWGYYRLMAFAVSRPFQDDPEETLGMEEAMEWANSGFFSLPSVLGEQMLTIDHGLQVLVYEFKKPRAAEFARAEVPGRWSCDTHLARSGILKF